MNPYEAPITDALGSEPALEAELASLGQRLLGAVLDGLILVACFIPGVFAVVLLPTTLDAWGDPEPHPLAMGLIGLGLLGVLAVSILQWVLIASRGQTLGKMAVGTRIVLMNGSPVNFLTGVILRLWILNVVTGVLNQCCLGWIVTLFDCLFIFQPDRRCLHDHLAGTKVIVHER